MDFRHKRNGKIITVPRNFDELEISKDFLGEKSDTKINITDLEFAGDEAIAIRERILNGLNGGVGIFEGDSYEIEVGAVSNPDYIFKGYLDFADNVEFISDNEVKVSLKTRKGGDWLNDTADGFSFRYLYSKGVITKADFVSVPYIINFIPDGLQLIMLSISTYMMVKELLENTMRLAYAGADVINASTPVTGVSVGLGAGGVVAFDWGDFIMVTIKLIATIVYVIAILIAIKSLIEEILKQLYPIKRHHLGMSIYTLFERGCDHLGLTLKSDLLTDVKNWVIIPQKYEKGGEATNESGVPTASSQFDTFGDLIRVFKRVFNADFRINENTFEFEREDFWQKQGDFVIKDYFTNQADLKDSFKPNVSEVVANYNINWRYDVQDQNTLVNQEGRVFQAILEPKVTNNKDLLNLKNLEEVQIPCSLGLRKNSLTVIEEVLKLLGLFVDGLTGILGGGTNFGASIEARKGSLLLSSDIITVPKMVVFNDGKLLSNQRALLSAKSLWNKYHYINSFVEVDGIHNQYYRYSKVKIPFSLSDFVNLLHNNFCKTADGKDAMIESLKWSVWNDYAEIDYRVKQKYTNNLDLKFIE